MAGEVWSPCKASDGGALYYSAAGIPTLEERKAIAALLKPGPFDLVQRDPSKCPTLCGEPVLLCRARTWFGS